MLALHPWGMTWFVEFAIQIIGLALLMKKSLLGFLGSLMIMPRRNQSGPSRVTVSGEILLPRAYASSVRYNSGNKPNKGKFMTAYEKHHIMDINIEDETQRHGRDITVSVDTHEMVTIEIGNSATLRTDEAGVDELLEALNRAQAFVEELQYEKTSAAMNKSEDQMIQDGIDAREKVKSTLRSDQQMVDVWNPNDPSNW